MTTTQVLCDPPIEFVVVKTELLAGKESFKLVEGPSGYCYGGEWKYLSGT